MKIGDQIPKTVSSLMMADNFDISINRPYLHEILKKTKIFVFLILLSACNPTNEPPPLVAIELEEVKVIFLDHDNPIKISAIGINKSELRIKTINGKIIGSDGFFFIHPKEIGTASITVLHYNKIIYQTKYDVKESGGFRAALLLSDGRLLPQGTPINMKTLPKVSGVDIIMKNINLPAPITVKSFRLEVANQNSNFVEITNIGSKFSKEQINLLKNAEIGKYVYISDIIGSDSSGSQRNLGSLSFLLID